MTTRIRLFAGGISMVFLFGCATTPQPVAEVRTETTTPAFAAAPQPVPLPMYAEGVEYSKLEKSEAAERADPALRETERKVVRISGKRLTAKAKKNGRSPAAAASPEFSADAELLARRDAYHQQLKQASYTFNPLSPIKVATPVTVFFWIELPSVFRLPTQRHYAANSCSC